MTKVDILGTNNYEKCGSFSRLLLLPFPLEITKFWSSFAGFYIRMILSKLVTGRKRLIREIKEHGELCEHFIVGATQGAHNKN